VHIQCVTEICRQTLRKLRFKEDQEYSEKFEEDKFEIKNQ